MLSLLPEAIQSSICQKAEVMTKGGVSPELYVCPVFYTDLHSLSEEEISHFLGPVVKEIADSSPLNYYCLKDLVLVAA